MENKFSRKEIIFLVITVFSESVVTYLLQTLVSNIYLTIGTIILVILIAIVLYLITEITRFSKILGIKNFYAKHNVAPKIDKIIESAYTSIDFIGISSRTVFDTQGIERLLIDKAESGVKFRFLILDPESDFLIQRAKDEIQDPRAWKAEIDANILRLINIKSKIEKNQNLHIAKYNSLPNWRNIFVDDNLVYSSFYPHGAMGKVAPVIIIEKKDNSLYIPLKTEFDHLWKISTENSS